MLERLSYLVELEEQFCGHLENRVEMQEGKLAQLAPDKDLHQSLIQELVFSHHSSVGDFTNSNPMDMYTVQQTALAKFEGSNAPLLADEKDKQPVKGLSWFFLFMLAYGPSLCSATRSVCKKL